MLLLPLAVQGGHALACGVQTRVQQLQVVPRALVLSRPR